MKWDSFPAAMKAVCAAWAVSMVGCFYLLQMFGKQCFVSFEVTDSVLQNVPPLHGKVSNLIKPMGLIAIYAFVPPMVTLVIFKCYVRHKLQDAAAHVQPQG